MCMEQELIFKLAFVITACSLSWGAALYFSYSSIIVVEKQRISSIQFRNSFILMGFSFLFFSITTLYTNFFTILTNNTCYILSFYFLKKGFFSLSGDNTKFNKVLKTELVLLLALLVIVNPFLFYIIHDSHILRTISLMLITLYYCFSCLNCINDNDEEIDKKTSVISLKICIVLMGVMLITLVVSGNSYVYLLVTMISQCLVIFLLFGSTFILFLGETSNQFKKESITDYLTGLYNRRHLNERFNEIINASQRNISPITLIMIDIDHFKLINDKYGHDAGDLIIKLISSILNQNMRASDIAARVGGEEFCLILPHTNINGAKLLSERIRKDIEAFETEYNHDKLKVTASFGISEVDIKQSAEEALKNTDVALYESKSNGRNRISIFSDSVVTHVNS